jgi:hypothetical protein
MTVEPSASTARANTATREAILRDALQEFETRLASRTRVPANKLGEFFRWSDDMLERESHAVSRILKRFAEAVVESMESPDSADYFLRELDLKAISRDHDWRAIFSTIRAQEDGYEGFKRAVLIKYLQYLSFRKRLVEFVRTGKRGLEDTSEHSRASMDALSFDLLELDNKFEADSIIKRAEGDFVRLPLGESVTIVLPVGRKANIMLAGHAFRLTGAKPPSLIDQNGVMYFLKEGRNIVGRHPESDIVIDPDFSDVSRAHVIVEWDGVAGVALVDLSSCGTFVRADALRPAEDG